MVALNFWMSDSRSFSLSGLVFECNTRIWELDFYLKGCFIDNIYDS